MEDVRFRGQVRPGDRLVMVGKAIRVHRRQTIFETQGFVGVEHGLPRPDHRRAPVRAVDEPDEPTPRSPIDVAPYTLDFPDAPLRLGRALRQRPAGRAGGRPGQGAVPGQRRARRSPGRNFVGVEMARKYARRAAERVAKRGLTTCGSSRATPAGSCAEFVPRGEPGRPSTSTSPTPGGRSGTRSVGCSTRTFVARRRAGPGARRRPAHRHRRRGILRRHAGADGRPAELRPQCRRPSRTTPEHDLDYLTNFERKYRIEGRPIYRAHYRYDPERTDAPP